MIGLYHYIALGLFAGFAVLELALAGREFPPVMHWRLQGAAFTLLYFAVATYAPLFWDGWLGEHRLFAADTLPLWAQILGGLLVLELAIYAWHRTMHSFDPLWRVTHQMHHSAERVDIWGAYYFHPVDMVGWALLGSLCLVWIIGLSADAALIVAVVTTIPGMSQHINIRTPHWLGYVVQRPESHAIHHQRGVHAYNYGDIPLFDMIFGTFKNPPDWKGEAGFHDGSTKQIAPMLFFRKIS